MRSIGTFCWTDPCWTPSDSYQPYRSASSMGGAISSAPALNQAIPGSRLILVEDAGHPPVEPAMIDALVGETDRLRQLARIAPPE